MAEVSGQIKPESGESPYMGLRYFDTSDADLFYGREALTDESLARVQKNLSLPSWAHRGAENHLSHGRDSSPHGKKMNQWNSPRHHAHRSPIGESRREFDARIGIGHGNIHIDG
jgi:hypothetical protein